jgi:hypothetical protein
VSDTQARLVAEAKAVSYSLRTLLKQPELADTVDALEAELERVTAALAKTPCVLDCNEIGRCTEFGFTCERCAVLAGGARAAQEGES